METSGFEHSTTMWVRQARVNNLQSAIGELGTVKSAGIAVGTTIVLAIADYTGKGRDPRFWCTLPGSTRAEGFQCLCCSKLSEAQP